MYSYGYRQEMGDCPDRRKDCRDIDRLCSPGHHSSQASTTKESGIRKDYSRDCEVCRSMEHTKDRALGRLHPFRNRVPEEGLEETIRPDPRRRRQPEDAKPDQLQRLCRPVPEQGGSARCCARDRPQPHRRGHPMPSGHP